MYEHKTTEPATEVLGALALAEVEVDGGVQPRRLPDALRSEIPTRMMTAMVDTAAGVRLRFSTSATAVSVRLRVHPLELVGLLPTFGAAVDLVVDGVVAGSEPVSGSSARLDTATDGFTVPDGEVAEVVFENLAPQSKSWRSGCPRPQSWISSACELTSPSSSRLSRLASSGSTMDRRSATAS